MRLIDAWNGLFYLSYNVMCQSFGMLDLQGFTCMKHNQSRYKVKVPSTTYYRMLMTKEFNNEISDSYTISFMGNEILLHKLNRERNCNQNP